MLHETTLVVADVTILQDAQGRYNLNLLHQASGSATTKRPTDWLRRKSTQALIGELSDQGAESHLEVVHGGERAGTYAHELLAVSYAGWISPAFQLRVNQAFLDMKRETPSSSLPILHDPSLQAILHLTIDLDHTKYELAQVKEQATRTEAKLEGVVNNQNFWTVAEYVQFHGLRRQCPESAYVEASRHVQAYCKRERVNYRDPNILPRRIPVGDKAWETEWGFHTSVFEAAFLPWLLRRNSQADLRLVPIPELDGPREAPAPYHRQQRR